MESEEFIPRTTREAMIYNLGLNAGFHNAVKEAIPEMKKAFAEVSGKFKTSIDIEMSKIIQTPPVVCGEYDKTTAMPLVGETVVIHLPEIAYYVILSPNRHGYYVNGRKK